MNFIFVCPERNEIFETANFHIVENRGVVTDGGGNRTLDAIVVPDDPCPLCGGMHRFHAGELACPFAAKTA